jgi:hypothetical protein
MSDEQLRLGKADPVPHTPAPWRAAQTAVGWRITGPTPRPSDRPMEWLIARLVSLEPEDEANVRLIVEAPALLAALKDLLQVIATDALVPESVSYMREARRVIARAEGRA